MLIRKKFILPADTRLLVSILLKEFYLHYSESLKHIDIVANGEIDEEMINVLEKYNAFSAIFETEIQNVNNIFINKLSGFNEAIDNSNNDNFIEMACKFTTENEREIIFPETEEFSDLFHYYLGALGVFNLVTYKHNHIFINSGIFAFFHDFISLFREGMFNEYSDFVDLAEELFIGIIEAINDSLDLEIDVPDFTELSQEEMEECMELYKQALNKQIEEGEILLLNFDKIDSFYEEYKLYFAKLPVDPPTNSKGAAAVLNYLNSNRVSLVMALREKGVQLSAVALQNDRNIAQIANIIYNMLPGMVRIFVSYDTVENFLLNNRQWLINKLV